MQDPKWMGSQPSSVSWSADGKSVYFQWNPDRNISDSTYSISINKTIPIKAPINAEFEQSASKGNRYRKTNKLVFSHQGDLYLRDLAGNQTKRITRTAEVETNPMFLVSGDEIVFQRNGNLYFWSKETGGTRQITDFNPGKRGSGNLPNPVKRDSLQSSEELKLMAVLQSRKLKEDQTAAARQKLKTDTIPVFYAEGKQVQNLKLSPDGRFLSYQLFEPASPNKSTLVPAYVNETGYTQSRTARENVGSAQGKFSFYLYDFKKGIFIPFLPDILPGYSDLPDFRKDYPLQVKPNPRGLFVNEIFWNESGTRAVLEVLSQDNKDRWLVDWNSQSGTFSTADRQRDEAWIGGPPSESKIEWLDENRITFLSEASGYSHLYSIDLATRKKTTHTSGSFEIQSYQLSLDKNWFYLMSNASHPGEQHWYRLSKREGSQMEKITSLTGGYDIEMSFDNAWIAYRYSSSNKPWELYIQENKPGGKPIQITNAGRSPEFSAYPWRDPELITFSASDGAMVHARLYKPEVDLRNGAAVVFVHGAGYLQNAHRRWSQYFREYMFHNLLADEGYTVIDVDYRGSSGYGRNWRTGIYRYMGGRDLEDQVDAVKYLVQNHQIDAGKLGIYGGSYGGFITLMALFTKPGMFKAGAALRSVTDWAHYNHGYTSNILNEPQTDSLAYRRSSPIYFAEGLQDRLLMCHGMMDMNVHFQDVVRLSQRLIELRKENWELAVYPVEDHGFVEPSSWADEYKRILKLFREELGNRK